MQNDFSDTICSISSPPGNGAIAVIRMSGEKSLSIFASLFKYKGKPLKPEKLKANTLYFGRIDNSGEIIDEVLAGIFREPKSYTGEDIVEISCHGSEYIQQRILEVLIDEGCRMARPGEFTQRAFLNGKMDLSQAEAVADLISSSTKAGHKVAMNQMRGAFRDEISQLREKLLHFISMIELELDFSEEDVEFADRNQLKNLLEDIDTVVHRLLASFKVGNVIKNGLPVAIVGHTNVGKSTLLNKLLNEEKAIVSSIAGTTRDVIEDVVQLEGIQFRFIDTAGIRDTEDTIENIGIERTFDRIDKAGIVLLLADASENPKQIITPLEKVMKRIKGTDKQLFLLINKKDSVENDTMEQLLSNLVETTSIKHENILPVSAITGENIDILIKKLVQTVNISTIDNQDVIVTNLRHVEALKHASSSLLRAKEGLDSNLPTDLLAQDIREVMHYLGEITGEIGVEEILGNIFGKFCIGK